MDHVRPARLATQRLDRTAERERNTGALAGVEQHAAQRRPGDRAGAVAHVIDIDDAPPPMRHAQQAVDRCADIQRGHVHPQRAQRAHPGRLQQQARAQRREIRVLFKDAHLMPGLGKRQRGRQPGAARAGDAHGKR
ncbi:hypothetical protein D3C71_1870460 [compost metagenome]